MALMRQRQDHIATSVGHRSSAASSSRWAALACIVAAPILLWCTPPSHPVGETSIAIIRRRGGADGRTSTSLIGAALAMNAAAPLFLSHTPSRLPIGESICAVVWVCRCNWLDRHGRWLNRHGHWHGQWCHIRASSMVNPAAPLTLVCLPCALCIHCTIEGIHRSRRSWCCCGSRCSGWRCRWRRWWWCGWCCGLRGECCRLSGGAPSAHGGAAELLLRR